MTRTLSVILRAASLFAAHIALFNFAGATAAPPSRSFVRTDSVPAMTLFDPNHQVIYATLPAINQVAVISTSQHTVLARIPVASAFSMDLSPDGSELIVGGGNSADQYAAPFLTLIDTSTLQVIKRIAVPLVDEFAEANMPLALEWTSNGTVLIVAYQFGTTYSALIQWTPSTNAFAQRILPVVGMEPWGLARSADGTKVLIYDGSSSGSNLVLYDANSDNFTANTFIDGLNVAANSNGSEFAVEGVGRLFFLDSSLNVSATLVISGYGSKPLFSPDGKSLYVSQNNGYTVFDTTTFMPTGERPAFWSSAASTLDGIDDVGEIFGIQDRGVTFNGFPTVNDFPQLFNVSTITPNTGSVTGPGSVTVNGNGFGSGDVLYFGGKPLAGMNISSSSAISATVPASATPGPVDVVLTNSSGGAVLASQGYSYGPTILYVQTNAGSTAGGTSFSIIGYGFNTYTPSQVQVTVGGRSASISKLGAVSNNYLPLQAIYVTSPPGNAGPATISVTTPAGNAVLNNGFFYYTFSSRVGPAATGEMIFDPARQVLYVTDEIANKVDIISPVSNQITGTLPTGSLPVGISMTPDGSTLVVANWSSQSVSIINIAAGTQQQFVLNLNGNGPGSLYPLSVGAASNGKAFVGAVEAAAEDNGVLFELDLSSGAMTEVNNTGLYLTSDIELHPFLGGSKMWIGSGDRGGTSGSGAVVWDAATESLTRISTGLFPESDIVDNGMVTSEGGAFYDPEGQLFSYASTLDLIRYPYIVYGARLHPGGGLFFRPYTTGPTGVSAVGVFDVHSGALLRQIGFSGNAGSNFDAMTLDDTGIRVFFSTDTGIATISLAPLPVSIGSLSPAQGLTAGGDQITIRGSMFRSGAAVTFAGIAGVTTWVDQNTLQVTTPPGTAGEVQVDIVNPDGSGYSLPAGFVYVSSIPTISSTTPTSAVPNLAIALSVYGSNFFPGSTIRWNGVAQTTTFVDESDLQTVVYGATVGSSPTTAKITILNPDGAVSSSFSLPVAYPPGELALGQTSYDFGPQLVKTASPPLITDIGNPGDWPSSPFLSTTGDFSQTNNCPGTMPPHTSCTVYVTFTPSVDGVSNGGLVATVAGAPSQTMMLSGRGIPARPALSSIPYSVDFLQTFIGSTPLAQSQVNIYSVGSANSTISSVNVSGDYQITQNTCQGTLTKGSWCYVFLTFAPTQPGTRTGTLTISNNAADTPLVVPLTGVAVQPFVVSPSSLSFGAQVVGTTATQQITVQNNSKTAIAALPNIDSPPNFSAVSNCGENIYPGTSCSVTVSFTPGVPGSLQGTLVLWEETGGTQETVDYPLAGNGVDFGITLAQGGANSATINPGQTATYNLVLSDNGYGGTVTVACTGAPNLATCSANPNSLTLSGTGSQAVTVAVQTSAAHAAGSSASSGLRLSSFLNIPVFLAAIMVVLVRQPRKGRRILTLACTLFISSLLLSCGGGGGSSGGSGGGGAGGGSGTSPGRYSLVVTAASNGATRSVNLDLNVN